MEETSTTEQARAAASRAVEESRETTATARQAAGSVAEDAREQAGVVAREVKDQARHLVAETRTHLRDTADTQTRNVAGSLQSFADELRALGRGQPDQAGSARRYVEMAGDTISDLASQLQSRDFDGLVRDVQQFARRRPGAFLAAAAGAGFVLARLVRSSADGAPAPGPNGQSSRQTAPASTDV